MNAMGWMMGRTVFVCALRRITQECRVGKGGRGEKERERKEKREKREMERERGQKGKKRICIFGQREKNN